MGPPGDDDEIKGQALCRWLPPRHQRLKALALSWARINGFAIGGLEVRIPRSGYRADVAAGGRSADAPTAIFECKPARSDLLKDAHAEAATRARLAELVDRRRKLEAMFTVHRPDLRRGRDRLSG